MISQSTLLFRKICSLGIVSLSFLLSMSYSSDSYTELYSSNDDLHLRSGPSTTYESISIIQGGDTVEVLSKENPTWFMVEYNGVIGYSGSRYLTPINTVSNDEEFKFLQFFILFPIFTIFSGFLWRFRFVFSIVSLFYGYLGIQWLYLGDIKWFSVLILELISLSPSIIIYWIGSIFTLYDMKITDFNSEYNNLKVRKDNLHRDYKIKPIRR